MVQKYLHNPTLPAGNFFVNTRRPFHPGPYEQRIASMDKYERRRLRLLQLRDETCHGKSAELARRINREPSYVTRMLYPEGTPGKKRIAEDMADVIEAAFSLPKGWLDSSESGPARGKEKETVTTIPAKNDRQIETVVALMKGMDTGRREKVVDFARWVSEMHAEAGKSRAVQ
jgi:hypothetical protein